MKQLMRRIVTVFMVMILSFGVVQTTQGISVQAAKNNKSKNAKVKKAYKKYLSNTVPYEKNKGKFALLDLNKDGVSEFIYTPDGDGYHVDIAAYVNGKAKSIGSGFSGIQKYYPNKHIYYSQTTHTGVDEYTYYKFTGKKLKVLAEKYGEINETGKSLKPYRYKVNGKKVSAKKYNAYVKKLLSGANNTKLKWHKNTAKNRKKYL